MANKNLNIGLTFNANTQQAKQQIRELKGALEGLTSSSLDKIGTDKFTSKVAKATSAVADLQGKLNAAINTDTGRLDLNKFTQSLQASGKTLKDYQQQFTALGSQGEKAFLQVSKAIANAEIPAQRTNAVIEKLWNSLKNVATWQLSSTILNSFTASLQEAYQYAQDLNKNLNDIRIVTGYGADEMDRFAVSANDAAKELSTTTNEYVKASLIYFQQGLSSQEVKKRTDATIKLANVTGESATTVSEWMTAIWNNFDDGSKSLEYYADVLTKLGAATASSSDEIAGGLEKFAAIAETVGLSYEYAATALATITAQTRQSEDVVGTGLRTIFSRLQSLSLGETLDDGTTLTKYSEALKKVGVNIQTASGELRQMDNILDDLGARWQSLSESERVALANTVGGVRQYTNLISLMDNWDVFKNNLTMAENSTGELNKQNEIYAESWEAANNRIKASMEDLYKSIVEDDVFITLTNGAADFIEIVDNMIDSLGGLKTLLPGVLAIMTKMFSDKMILGARSISTNYKEQLQAQQKNFAELRVKSAKQYEKGVVVGDTSTSAEMVEATGKVREASFEAQALSIKRELTTEEKNLITSISTEIQQQNELLVQARKRADSRREEAEAAKKATDQAKEESEKIKTLVEAHQKELQILQKKKEAGKLTKKEEKKRLNVLEKELNIQEQLTEQVKDLSKQQKNVEEKAERAQEQFDEIEKTTNKIAENGEKIVKDMSKPKLGESIMNLTQSLTSMAFALSSIFNLWDVLTDPDVSGWEKFTTTFTTLIPLIISAKSAITSFGKVNMQTINESTGKLLVDTGAWIKNKFAIDKNKESRDKSAKTTDKNEKEIEEETNAIKENNIQTKISTELKKDNEGREYTETSWTQDGHSYSIREFTETKRKSYFIDGDGTSKKGKSKTVLDSLDKAKKTEIVDDKVVEEGAEQSANLLTKLKGNLKAAGPWVAIVAGITLFITTIKLATDHYKRFDTALKASQQNLQLQQDALQGVVEETNNLKTSMSDYSEGIRNLDKLTKGTTEYKEALIASNKAALELIQKHKNLKYEMKDGAIVIDEDSLDQAYQEQLNEQYAAQNRVAIAQMSTNQAQATRDRVEAARDINSGFESEGFDGARLGTSLGVGASAGAVASGGAALLTTYAGVTLANGWNPVGWGLAIAGAVALLTGAIYTGATEMAGIATETETYALEHLEEISKEKSDLFKDADTLKNYLNDTGDAKLQEFANAIGDDVTAIQALVESNAQLERQNDLLAETVAANTAAMMGYDNEEEQAVAQGNLEALWKTGQYEEQTKKAAETLLSNGGFMGIGSDDDWAALIEQTVYKGQNVELKDLEGTGVSLYKDGTLQGEKNAISQDTLTSQAANIMFSEYMAKGEKYWEEFATQGISAATIKTLKDAFSNLTSPEELRKQSAEDYKNYSRDLNAVDILDDKQSVRNAILTAVASGETDEIDLSSLSAEEIEELKKDIENKSGEVYDALRTAADNWGQAVKNANIQASEGSSVSEHNRKNLSQTLKDAGIDKEAFDIYTKTLAEAYNMTEEFAERFAEARLETTYGIISLNKSLNSNINTLKTANKTSIEYSKSLTEVQKSLTNWLDTELDRETVEKLVKSGTLEKAAQGDIEAIKAVEQAGSEAVISSLQTLNAGVRNNLQEMSNAVYSMNLQEGDSILAYMDKLGPQINTMLNDIQTGALSTGDAIEALNSMNFEVTDDFELQLQALYEGKKDIDSISWDSSLIKYIGINYDKDAVKKALDNMEDALDRYWSIDRQLESSEIRLNRISKAQDRAFGGAKLKALKTYQGELAKNNDLLQKKLQEADFWMQKDLEKLISLDLNLKFDADGNIENYKQALSGLMGEDLKKAQKAIENYRGSLSTYASVQDEIIDNNYELEDSKLEEIDLDVNLKTQAADFALENIERLLDRLENKAFDAAAAISLMGDQLAPTMDKIEAANKGIEDIFSKNGLEKYLNDPEGFRQAIEAGKVTLNEADIEKLKEYYDTMEEGQDALLEVQSQVYDMLIQAMEEFNNKLKEQSEILEHQSSILEQYENIIDLIGKKNLGINSEILKEISQAQIDLAEGQLKAAKARRDTTQEDLATAQSLLDAEKAKGNDADPTTIKKLEETIKAAEDAAKEAETDFMTSWVNALEAAADAFEKSINRIAEEFSKSVSGIYGSIEEMRAAFDRQQEVSKRFLADYEKTYEISKLNRNITNQIDNTKNVKAQRQLAELASEINAYSIEDRQMSKIDLEYMQKKYDLMVAQIALEEAQNAKNQVRLTRDSEGNWGYVYTANESDTEKAQQNVEDKKYAMEKSMTSTEYNLTTQMIQLNEDYENELNELAEKYGTDSELFKQESEKLAQRYSEDLQYIMDEYSKLTERGAIDAQEWGLQVSTTYDQTLIHSIYPTYKNFGELQNGVTVAMESSILSLGLAYEAYYDTVQETMSNAGTSIKTFANVVSGENGTGGYLGTVKEAVEKVQQAVKTLVEQHTNAEAGFPAAENALDNWKTKWEKTAKALNQLDFTAIKTNLSSIYELYNKINSSSIKAPSTMSNYKWTEDTYTDNNGMTWRKFYNTETNEEYWIDEEKVSSYGDGSGKGQFSMSGSDMNIQIREGTIKSNDAMIDQQNKDYKPTSSSKQNYGRVSAHDTTINGVKYYAYQKVNDGKLDTTSEITYLTETDAKKYASYTEEKHTRGGQAAYRNVQFATGTDTHTAKDLDSLQTNKSISVDHFVAAMDYSKETPTLYYLIPSKNQRVSSENAQLVGRSLVYQSDDAESYDCSNVFWGTILVAKDSATFSDRYGIDITKYEYPETERRSAGTWVSDEKTVRKAEYLVDKVIIGKDKHLYYKLSSGQDNKVKIYGGEWYLASDLDKAFQSKLGSFDTGGYTGDWGPEGKLAVLHQKEIILNAHDTENFLTAIQIVRSLSDKLERNALLANQGLGNIIASSNLSLGGDTLEQHVTITAEFPNVVDHNEIEEAFNTLVNQASQYANR